MTSAGISFTLTLFTHDDAVIMGIAISAVALLIYVAGVRRGPSAASADKIFAWPQTAKIYC